MRPLPDPFRLHVGGKEAREGWMILNAQPGPGVDFVGRIQDLSQFGDACCDVIYASHVLEHVAIAEVLPTLKGFWRILKPGCRALIAVPDLEILSRLMLRTDLGRKERFHVMTMIYGGQTDEHDFHKVGFHREFLAELLMASGFGQVQAVERFGLFDDGSEFAPYGGPISLNLIAQK